jgi:murein DD-endopeptidase MepM/ murein hydrolase activator NlpD
MRHRVSSTLLLVCALSISLAGIAEARKPSAAEKRAALRDAAEHELELTETANALERGQAALERERESLDWASELLEQRGRESLRKLATYSEHRVEREAQTTVRARQLYKLARGGGMLEAMFEDGADGRLTPSQRSARGRTLRRVIDQDLELLRVHADAETRAADELLTATRELDALMVLDSVGRMQAEALALTGAQLDPELAAAYEQRRKLQKRGRKGRAERQLLRTVERERRNLQRHRGLDLLEEDALMRPVDGRVVGGFGEYRDRVLQVPMTRNGVELAGAPNDPVRAIAPGEIVLVGALPGFERVVVIDHGGGYLSLTARLLSVVVSEGDDVEAGTVLGRVGAKAVPDGLGTTVYLEIRHGQRPIDPAQYLRSRRR